MATFSPRPLRHCVVELDEEGDVFEVYGPFETFLLAQEFAASFLPWGPRHFHIRPLVPFKE